jgi:hypothetical protein
MKDLSASVLAMEQYMYTMSNQEKLLQNLNIEGLLKLYEHVFFQETAGKIHFYI